MLRCNMKLQRSNAKDVRSRDASKESSGAPRHSPTTGRQTMFRSPWLYAPPERPLATRLYTRTYGRTYGRRPVETDQPTSLPHDLHLSASPASMATTDDCEAIANIGSLAA
jgi:hypothetical protein